MTESLTMAPALPGDIDRYLSLFRLEDRNAKAHRVIAQYAAGHAAMDVALGVAGLFVPGGGLVATVASLAAQAPLVYRPMTRDLAGVYGSAPDAFTESVVIDATKMGAFGDVASEFGAEFFGEILGEVVQEAGFGAVAAAMPVVGGLFAAAIDATIAATLTWRVGTMVSTYFQNGRRWAGSRHATYEFAKSMVDGFSPVTENRANLNDVPLRSDTVKEGQVAAIIAMVRTMMGFMSRADITNALAAQGIPVWLVELAICRVFR